jgi:hypothetical protein
MPFVQSPDPTKLDTSELEQGAPPQSLPAYQDDTGTGANGPKYTTGEFWSGVARRTIPGQAITDIRAARAAGYNPLTAGESVEDPATAIPEDMKPFADKYVGLYTKEQIAYRTFQLRQSHWDELHGGQSKWSIPANLAAGLVDPIGVGSMFIPVAGETRLANAIRMAAVGAGVSATDEAVMSQLDPNWTFANSMVDVGAGTLVSGILGAIIRPHASSSELGKLRAMLQEDLHAAPPEPPRAQSGDSAANIAADLRAAVESHGQGLERAAEEARTASASIDPAAAAQRLQTAQEALSAVPREAAPEAQEAALKAKAEELGTGEGVPERLAKAYGDKVPEVLQGRAASLVAAQKASREAIEREVSSAQEDLNRLEQARSAQESLQAFHETEKPPAEYTGPHGAEPLPSGIRPGGEPGVRPELSAEQGPLGAGGGQPGESIPRRPTGRGARGGEDRGSGASQREPGKKGAADALGRSRQNMAHTKEFRAIEREGIAAMRSQTERAEAVRAGIQTVEAHVASQLEASGRLEPKQIGANSKLIGAFYGTQAQRLGLTADELFARHPLKVTGEAKRGGFLQRIEEPGIEVGERGMTPEEEKLFAGLRASTPGKEPLTVYRGGRSSGPLTAEHFKPESFGKATNRPSAGLGVFFTNRPAEAGRYGKVSTHHLDMKQPLHIRSEDLPGFDSTEAATAWARAQEAKGYDGLIIDASHVGGQTWYVPFKLEQVKHAGAGVVKTEPGRFAQENRGSYDPASHTIALTDSANASTFLHESGHHFLDLMTQLAEHPDAPLSMREDVQSLMDWFKVKDLNEWKDMGLEGQRDLHEKFAQGFEQYLRDGVAPSSRLQGLFDQFRQWLSQVYKSVVNQFGDRLPQDVRSVMDRLLATDEEATQATAERVAAAPNPTFARIAGDAPLRDELRHMAANELGWDTVGGKMIRKEVLAGGRGNEFDISRTAWIPRAEWWPGRPGGYSAEESARIVDKALAGEKLGPKQQQLLEYMTEVADQRVSSEPFLPHADELSAHELEHSPANAFESAMVARLSMIDEEAVENLARHFEDDDAGFMAKVKELLDAHDEDAKLARGVAQDQEPLGLAPDRGAAGGSAESASARGETPGRAAAAEGERPATRSAPATDLFGERPTGAQALADEQRRRDLKRNSGQESAETGNPGDLFSQARQQADLTDMLAKLPPEARAPFEARIEALEEPGHAPIYAAPEGGQSMGAAETGRTREQQLKDYSLARGGRVLGKALGWFAPGSRALSSPALAMRKTMARLIETPEMLNMNVPSPERPFGLPTPIAVQTILKKWEGNWAKAFAARDQIFRDYRARPQAEVEGPKLGKHEFNEQVSMAMRRNDTWYIKEVEDAAKATRAIVFDPLKEEAKKLGLLPQEDPTLGGTAESYLMRQYDRAKIQKDQVGWHQTLVDGFVKQGVEATEASEIAHAVTRNILGTELGLLDTNKSAFHNVPQSGRLKERTLKLPDLDLEKYLTNDIDTLSHSYLKSLAPQVEMMKMFRDDLRNDGLDEKAQGFRVFTPDPQAEGNSLSGRRNLTGPAKDITDEYSILKQRALAAGDNAQANALDKRLKSDLRDLAAVRDRLYGIYGAPGDSSSWLQRAGRVIRSVNALRLLGTATWSHVPDLANIVMKRGLPQTMAVAAKLSSSLEALNLNREQMHRIGTVMDMIHNTTAAALGEFGVESSYALQKTLNRATRAFTIATLETPWIATCKALAGAAAHDEVLEAAGRASRFAKRVGPDLSTNERIRFNQMGLDQGMLERIAEQYGEYGKSVNGVRFGLSDTWHDQGAAQAIDAVTTNAAEGSTLSPGAGDTPLWTSNEVGKAIFQFKTFGAVAIRRVTIPLAQGLAHADLRSAQGLATLIAAGAVTYTMKQLLSGQPMEKDPGRYALEVLDKSNLLGWTGEYFYPSLWQFGMGNFSRWGDRQTWETLGGPVAGTAVDAWDLRLPAKLIGTARGQGPQLKRSDIHRIRRMLPGNQVWYLRRAVNALEGHVGDAMGLPPADVPGSTE